MKTKTLLFLSVLLFLNIPCLQAQFDEFVCGHSDEQNNSTGSMGNSLLKGGNGSQHFINSMNPNPPGRNFKVTVLYFKRADDTFNASDPIYSAQTRCLVNEWAISSGLVRLICHVFYVSLNTTNGSA